MSDASLAPGGRDGSGQARPAPGPSLLSTSLHSPWGASPSLLPPGLAQALGTYKVLRPLRPRNMRPCTVSSWFPVSISSCTPAAPSKAPSLTSLILLLLRFLEGGGRMGQGRCREGVTTPEASRGPSSAPGVRTGWWGARSWAPGCLSAVPGPGGRDPSPRRWGYLCETDVWGSSFPCPGGLPDLKQ